MRGASVSSPDFPAKQLRIPGPTPIPERVRVVSSRQMINHRSLEFTELLTEIVEGLQYVLHTSNDVLLFPSSGTGGLEAAAVNMLSPGEPALFCVCGSFGKRWADIADAYGAKALRLNVPAGTAAKAEAVSVALEKNPDVKTVFVTHNETSTGVTNPVEEIARVVKSSGRQICVDSVSGAGCLPLEVDRLGLDVVVTGSQKGWMSPPGLTMLSVGNQAFETAANAATPRWYFDFAREKRYQDKGQTYITPPLSVMYALQECLRMIREEGVQETWNRHARVAGSIRAGVQRLGLELLAEEGYRSDTVTAVRNPAGDPAGLKKFTTHLKTTYGVEVAGGQDDLQGQVFRIGHLGWVDDSDVVVILAAVEATLNDLGLSDISGAGRAAGELVAQTVA